MVISNGDVFYFLFFFYFVLYVILKVFQLHSFNWLIQSVEKIA